VRCKLRDVNGRTDYGLGSAHEPLGPDEIRNQAGRGGMGDVYKARDTRLNRIVAIKVRPRRLRGGLIDSCHTR